jgi:hypothetical protein
MGASLLGHVGLDISFGEFLWSLVIIFFMIIFFVILFQVLIDLFRDDSLSGWAKAGWVLFIIILPFLGLLVYLIVRGRSMAAREVQERRAQQSEADAYIRSVAGGTSSVDEIARAKQLLDSGAITQDEFEAIKRKSLG